MGLAFSNTTTKAGILQRIEQECGMNDGDITGNTVLLARFTALVNQYLNMVFLWIRAANPELNVDDSNNTGMPIETYSFVDDQQDYSIDSDIGTIKKIEAHDATKTEPDGWYDLDFLEQKDLAEDRFDTTSGKPSYYWFQWPSFLLDVAPDTAVVDKYRITYDQHAHLFVTTDTTAQPGFDAQVQDILIYGPALSWLAEKGKGQKYNHCFMMLYGVDPVSGRTSGDNIGLKDLLEDIYMNKVMTYKPAVGRDDKNYG